jgi:PAS domain S-box-containing protein
MGRTIERQMSQLRESEERYRTIFDNSPVGIFRTTFEGALLEGNPALARMFGYVDQYEFMGSDNANVQAVYADPAARLHFLQTVLQSDSPVSIETEFVRKDGTAFDAVLTASVQRDGGGSPLLLNGAVEDVSARKEAERSLARERQLMAAIFESVPGLEQGPRGHDGVLFGGDIGPQPVRLVRRPGGERLADRRSAAPREKGRGGHGGGGDDGQGRPQDSDALLGRRGDGGRGSVPDGHRHRHH